MTGKTKCGIQNKERLNSIQGFHIAAITALLVETNRYYKQYLDFLDDGQSPVLGVPEYEVFVSGSCYSNWKYICQPERLFSKLICLKV
jgi:hypothetical protein